MTELTAPTTRKRPKRGRAVLLGVATVAVLSGGAALACLVGGQVADNAEGGTPFTINVSVTLDGNHAYVTAHEDFGAACEGDGGYDDIRAGAQVAVRDASGAVVAVGQLEQGYSSFTSCTLNATIADVPGSAKFYGITVANRNELQYSRDQLSQRIELTLG